MNLLKTYFISGFALSAPSLLLANTEVPTGIPSYPAQPPIYMPVQPLYAPPVYTTAPPQYAPQPSMPVDDASPVFVSPEYVEKQVQPVENTVSNQVQAEPVMPAGPTDAATADVQPPTDAPMPPIGAYGYADDPATYTQPDSPIPGQAEYAAPPMSSGYDGYDPYYGQAYPPADYAYPQWVPDQNQNNNPFNNLGSEFFSGQNPFTNPMDNNGYWAKRDFRPWSSGPLAPDRWGNHPMNNMPWGRFPGWGDGFFGGFGPDDWRGITPWGNNVPFRWIDPAEPRESIANMWDDAINTPNNMGRMPPGWTAPYISVPNPVDVADEFEKNARKFPDEINNMIDIGED